MNNNKIILHCPTMSNFNFSSPCKVMWDNFSDGTPNIFITDACLIRNCDVYFLADFQKQENIFRQLSVIYALPHLRAKSLTIFLPYFPTATMERVDRLGQIATAKTLMRMLNAIPLCHGSGPAKIIIYDIHSLAVQHFHADGVIIDLQSAVPLLFKHLKDFPDYKNAIFAFPDEGARKRFHTYFTDPCIICTKDENKKVTIKEGKELVQGANIIIIDDMIRGGDTLINCSKTLFEQGANEISAYATHGVFPEDSWQKVCNYFTHIWVTDSCPSTYHNVDIISLFDLILEEIRR